MSMANCLFGSSEVPVQIRNDDIVTPFKFDKVVFGSDAKIEYGSQQPFKKMTVSKWIASLKDVGKAQDSVIEEPSWADELVNAKVPTEIPEGVGCSPELIRKFCEFMKLGK